MVRSSNGTTNSTLIFTLRAAAQHVATATDGKPGEDAAGTAEEDGGGVKDPAIDKFKGLDLLVERYGEEARHIEIIVAERALREARKQRAEAKKKESLS